jgi:translation initiation factor IF-2
LPSWQAQGQLYFHLYIILYTLQIFLILNLSLLGLGFLASMHHLKNEVTSIKKDVECGLRLEDGTIIFKPGDSLICYEIRKEEQTTDWDPGF